MAERTFFSIHSAADYLGISYRHLDRMMESDGFEGIFWIGDKRFVTKAKLDEWWARRKPKPHNGRPKGIATLIRSAR